MQTQGNYILFSACGRTGAQKPAHFVPNSPKRDSRPKYPDLGGDETRRLRLARNKENTGQRNQSKADGMLGGTIWVFLHSKRFFQRIKRGIAGFERNSRDQRRGTQYSSFSCIKINGNLGQSSLSQGVMNLTVILNYTTHPNIPCCITSNAERKSTGFSALEEQALRKLQIPVL